SVVAGGRFVRLPNGDYLAIEDRIRRVMDALAHTQPLGVKSGELRVHDGAIDVLGTLAEVAQEGGGFSLDTAAEAWLARVAAHEGERRPDAGGGAHLGVRELVERSGALCAELARRRIRRIGAIRVARSGRIRATSRAPAI